MAFTLIEVLVVVAIIALLVAILLPSLLRAKEQSTGVLCRSNQKQIMLGMHTYVAENKVLPGNGSVMWTSYVEAGHTGLPSGPTNWRPSDSWLGLPWSIAQFSGLAMQQALWDFVAASVPQKGALYRYVKNEGVYLCPKDKKGIADPIDPKGGGGNGRFSYTTNGLIGFKAPEACTSFRYVADFQVMGGAKPPPVATIKSGTKVQWTMSRMPALFEEHPWNNTNHGYIVDDFAADAYLTYRHFPDQNGGLADFAFLDGHAEGKRYLYTVKTNTVPPTYSTLQGVDIYNDFRLPYSYAGNNGGGTNVNAFIHHFKYPY